VLARETAASYRAPELRLCVVEHPLGAIPTSLVRERAAAVVDVALRAFTPASGR
jgi:hypothetical protein